MRNVTEQPGVQALRVQLNTLLSSYRFTLYSDELELRAAMAAYEQSCRPAPAASKAA